MLPGFADVGPRESTHFASNVVPFRLDRCLVHGLTCRAAAALAFGPSDHRPIRLELDIAEGWGLETAGLHTPAAIVPAARIACAASIDRGRTMLLNLSQIGQIALPVADVDRAEAFYERVIGLRKLYRFGDLSFFDCAGVRLLLEKAAGPITAARLHLFPLCRHRAHRRRA